MKIKNISNIFKKQKNQPIIHSHSKNIKINGCLGTWYVINTSTIADNEYYLLASHEKENFSNIITNNKGKVLLNNVTNGFESLHYFFNLTLY